MMIDNPVDIYTGHVTTKNNVVADKISRIKKEANSVSDYSFILQDYPKLAGRKPTWSSAALISHIMDDILQERNIWQMEVNNNVLTSPRQIISFGGPRRLGLTKIPASPITTYKHATITSHAICFPNLGSESKVTISSMQRYGTTSKEQINFIVIKIYHHIIEFQ